MCSAIVAFMSKVRSFSWPVVRIHMIFLVDTSFCVCLKFWETAKKQHNTKKFYLIFRHLFHFNEYPAIKIWNMFLEKSCMTFNTQIISETEEHISVSKIEGA